MNKKVTQQNQDKNIDKVSKVKKKNHEIKDASKFQRNIKKKTEILIREGETIL